ncbi:MAG: DUF2189 domain-containing protein [Allosphingosinicella sp.]|uniref:DUF2189 domain-containing protein n=1 Tax=Allosphingosinicella sp. TaxID=2823234 RepID=UPI0039473F14
MALTKTATTVPGDPARAGSDNAAYPVRRVTTDDLKASLRDGYRDFIEHRGDLIFIGLIYPLIGLVAAAAALGGTLSHYFFPIAFGVALLGPVAATGFYEIARRQEDGLESDWSHFLDIVKRPSFDSITAVIAVLLVIFGFWIAVAGLLYAGIIGPPPGRMGEFVERLFTTSEGWSLIAIGNLVGLAFAVLVLAVSVVSLPMLVDRDVGARSAIATSVAAVRANFGVMFLWGLTVLALLVLGSLPLFVGLAFVLPWLGYATWHLYTRAVDRSALPPPAE